MRRRHLLNSLVINNQEGQYEYITQNYCVLQRYDFSRRDLEKLNCNITYPPTEEMSDIRMFPRYKEY